jgi:hypothetical protein
MRARPTDLKDVKIAEEDVHAILERAVQLDSTSLSLHDLSSAAREAGISEDALLEAVREVLAAKDAVRAEDGSKAAPRGKWDGLRTAARMAIAALGGGVMGILSSRGDGAALFAVLIILVVTAFRAFHHREDGAQRDFQIEVASIWAGLVAGMSIGLGRWWDDVLVMGAGFWLASAAMGGTIVASKFFRRFRPSKGEEDAG